MNERELYYIADNGPREFRELPKLKLFFDDLFGENLKLPSIIASEACLPNSRSLQRIQYLPPLNSETELTVRNYLAGLEELETNEPGLFMGAVSYLIISSNYSSDSPFYFFNVNIHPRKRGIGSQNFDLNCFCLNDVSSYRTVSSLSPTRLEQLCGKFVGPNRE